MAIPLIAAGIVARAIASKLATRAVGGITGAGAKTVAPVYKNTGNVKVISRIEQGMPEGAQKYKSSNFGVVTQKLHNQRSDMFARKTKTGKVLKEKIKFREEAIATANRLHPLRHPKKPTVKIKSGK